MKKETPEEFKDSLMQEIIKLKGLDESFDLKQHLMLLYEKQTPELISLKNRLITIRKVNKKYSVEREEPQLLTTQLYIVINEETLETLKDVYGVTAKFTTRKDADDFASERLELWSIKEIFFKHKWINHTPNY